MFIMSLRGRRFFVNLRRYQAVLLMVYLPSTYNKTVEITLGYRGYLYEKNSTCCRIKYVIFAIY